MSARLISRVIDRGEKPLRVLLVDDDAFVREIVSASLQDMGLEITEVHSGARAIELLLETPDSFDALITDLTLPGGISGAQVAAKMRTLRPGVPVVLMSGSVDALAEEADPAVHTIAKPFFARDLFRLLALPRTNLGWRALRVYRPAGRRLRIRLTETASQSASRGRLDQFPRTDRGAR